MNPLNGQRFYRGFRKALRARLGAQKAASVWAAAGREFASISAADPSLKKHKGAACCDYRLSYDPKKR